MSFYNTGNPVPSIDPRDLDDNAKHIDELANSTFPTFVDRLGATRRTLAGIEADADAATLRGDLAEPEGSGMLGAERVAPVVAVPASAEFFFSTKKVNIWEYAKYLTSGDKPDVNDPNTWNWTAALAQAGQLGKRLIFTDGTFMFSESAVAPGTQIEGEGGGRFSGNRTILKSISSGQKLLVTSPSVSSFQRDGFAVSGVRIVSDFGITFGDPTKLIVDAGGTSAYEMKPYVGDCSFAPITPSAGYACLFAKCFDHVLERCDVSGFARGVVEVGSDIGEIKHNRIINFSEYGILQLSTGTFGSQTLVTLNDVLNGGAGSTYIKTTSRHVRIIDNYLERSSGVSASGFIDVSTTGAPTYGPNTVSTSTYLSVDVDLNRLDGQNMVTDFIYRYEPIGYNVRIVDVGTSGTHNGTLPWLTVTGDCVPMFSTVNTGNAVGQRHEFISSGERRWNEFRPEALRTLDGGVTFNHLSIMALNQLELRRNNAFLNVRLNDHSILLKSALSTTLFHCILPTVTVSGVDVNNPWLRSGISYTVTVIARMVSGTGTFRLLKIVDAASQGSAIDTALGTQAQKITTTMTGVADTSKVGVAFAHNVANTTDIEILSVTFKEA